MRMKPVYQHLNWEVPGFDLIGKDCRYTLIAEAPAYVKRGEARQVIVFQETEWSACIDCIANHVHEAIDCPAPKLDDEQGEIGAGTGHICLELMEHWIRMGILIQTYSPN